MNIHVHPASQPLIGTIDPPSSKNYTTRFILASCLADGESTVEKPAVQDDAVALVRCMKQFGATIDAFDSNEAIVPFEVSSAGRVDRLRIRGFGNRPETPSDVVDPANAGTVLRLLIGMAALCEGEVRFETAGYKDSLGKRPNADLLDALRTMGIGVDAGGADGRLPIALRGGRKRILAAMEKRRAELGIPAGQPVWIPVSGAVSSQFLSSLLFMAPLVGEPLEIRVVEELKSRPLIRTTCSVLEEAGIRVEVHDEDALPRFILSGDRAYRPRTWTVNGDWPGSAAILGAAAVVPGSSIRVERLREDEQGERRCLDFYRAMGCRAELDHDGLSFESPQRLTGASIDGDQCTDAVLAMMGAAAAASGDSLFEGIANLQYKECDRVREPIAELRAIAGHDGIAKWQSASDPELITVAGQPDGFDGGMEADGRGDHRVIMMLSIVALRCRRGLTIRGAEHVAKSFPGWFDTLRAMGVRVELV